MSSSHTQKVLVKLFKFQQGTLTTVIIIIIFWNISSGISLKLEKKNDQTFSSFNSFPSLPASFATDDRNQFQRLNMVLNNRSASLFLNFNC